MPTLLLSLLFTHRYICQELDVKKAQRIAALSGDKGCKTLASLGTDGLHAANVERDLHRRLRKAHPFLRGIELYSVEVPFEKQDGLGIEFRDVSVLLPHEAFAALAGHSATWEIIFGVGNERRKFWEEARSEQWFALHRKRDEIAKDPQLWVPIRLHGDDAAFHKVAVPLLVCFPISE